MNCEAGLEFIPLYSVVVMFTSCVCLNNRLCGTIPLTCVKGLFHNKTLIYNCKMKNDRCLVLGFIHLLFNKGELAIFLSHT